MAGKPGHPLTDAVSTKRCASAIQPSPERRLGTSTPRSLSEIGRAVGRFGHSAATLAAIKIPCKHFKIIYLWIIPGFIARGVCNKRSCRQVGRGPKSDAGMRAQTEGRSWGFGESQRINPAFGQCGIGKHIEISVCRDQCRLVGDCTGGNPQVVLVLLVFVVTGISGDLIEI